MRTRLAALLLVLAGGLGGCGDSTERPVVGAGTVSTPTTTTTATTGDGRVAQRSRAARDGRAMGCAERGITVPPFNEGACVQDGTRFVVANGRTRMRLSTMSVAIRGFAVAEVLRRGGQRLTPQGAFLQIELQVRNRTGRPQRFAAGQTLLLFERQRFQEHIAAEQRFHPGALAFAGRDAMQPGEVVDGVVVYDVAVGDIERITSEGQLLVANLGAAARRGPRELGQFRIGVG
jgi:hypothetical protein